MALPQAERLGLGLLDEKTRTLIPARKYSTDFWEYVELYSTPSHTFMIGYFVKQMGNYMLDYTI